MPLLTRGLLTRLVRHSCQKPDRKGGRGLEKRKRRSAGPAAFRERCGRILLRSGILPVKLCSQPVEIRIKRHKASRALKEGAATRVVRDAIQRTLAITGGEIAAAGQTDRRRIERKDRRVAPVRFADSPLEIDCVTRGRCVKTSRSIKSIG